MAGPGRPASPRAPVAAETDRPDPPRDGPPRWAGRGSSLPGAPGLGLGGPDSSWAALRSVCFALGPAPEVGTGPDCGLEVAGGRTWVRALGCFLNEVLSASHSGGGDPPAGVVRVDGERRARVRSPPPPPPNPTPWGPVAEASPGTHAVTFSKSRWVRRRGWTGPCFRGWPGRARSTLQRALVGLGRRT